MAGVRAVILGARLSQGSGIRDRTSGLATRRNAGHLGLLRERLEPLDRRHGLLAGHLARELKCLAEEGRLVFIATLGGSKAELDINEMQRRRLSITGSTLRPRPVAFKGAIAKSLREKIWPLIEAGRIKPVIYKTFPLAQASEAHRLMESSQHIGKIVLSV